jgi:hypothetical protein
MIREDLKDTERDAFCTRKRFMTLASMSYKMPYHRRRRKGVGTEPLGVLSPGFPGLPAAKAHRYVIEAPQNGLVGAPFSRVCGPTATVSCARSGAMGDLTPPVLQDLSLGFLTLGFLASMLLFRDVHEGLKVIGHSQKAPTARV